MIKIKPPLMERIKNLSMVETMTEVQNFFNALSDLFIGAKIEADARRIKTWK